MKPHAIFLVKDNGDKATEWDTYGMEWGRAARPTATARDIACAPWKWSGTDQDVADALIHAAKEGWAVIVLPAKGATKQAAIDAFKGGGAR